MAQIPAAAGTAAAAGSSAFLTSAVSFVANLGASYLLGRLTAQDGQRLDNLAAAGGDYGVAMPRAGGTAVRLAGIPIGQADILETKHTVEDYSEIIGVVSGAAQGFMLGGPVGAVIGGVIGGILGFAAPNQHYYTYSDTFAVLFLDRTDDDPTEGISKMFAIGKTIFNGTEAVVSTVLGSDGKLISKKYGKNKYFTSLTFYAGHSEQGVDPILASAIGENGGHVYSAYAVVEKLQLAPFGNSVPTVEGLVTVKTGQSVAEFVEFVANAGGIDPIRDLSTTALNDFILAGYALTSATSCWDALKPMLPVFGVDAAEVGGQIRFYKRSQTMRATIRPDEMGAYIYDDSPPEKFMFSRDTDLNLPRELALTFLDPERDYQENTQTARRSEGSASSNIATSIPLVMTASEGASVAMLMLWDTWLGRTAITFSLTDAWRPEAGLAYGISAVETVVPYRITRATRGANGITEVEARSDESVTYTANEPGTSGTMPDPESTEFADTRLVLIDGAITSDNHDDYGFYIVQAGSESDWERGAIQVSSDGVNYVTIIDQPQSAVIGDVTGTLAAGTTTGLDDTLDTTSVLTVALLHDGMTLESATDAELDNWKNFAFVGKDGLGEYLQFKTATFVSGTTWQLTNLRRGRKGTDYALGTHASGEEFALLGGEGFFRIVYSDTSQWGVQFHFRGVTLHQDEADAAVIDFTNTGEGKRPYSPVNVEGSWDGSYNLTITWDARSRLNAGGLGIDDQNNYEVEIISGAGRTITATGVESAAYSAANQTTDGLTPGDSITGRVRQLSDVNNGRWRDFTLLGPNAALILEDDTTFLELEDDATVFELG